MSKPAAGFTVLLTEDERQLLVQMATREERRPGDMLRRCLREAARQRGLLSELVPAISGPAGCGTPEPHILEEDR